MFSTVAFSRGCVRLEFVRSLCQGVLLCDDFLSGLCDPSPPSRAAGANSSGTCTACSPGSYSASPGAISPSRQWILPLRIIFGQRQYLAPVACSLYPELHCSSTESTLLCRSFLPHFLCYVQPRVLLHIPRSLVWGDGGCWAAGATTKLACVRACAGRARLGWETGSWKWRGWGGGWGGGAWSGRSPHHW
jgi:hypothetical protein